MIVSKLIKLLTDLINNSYLKYLIIYIIFEEKSCYYMAYFRIPNVSTYYKI
jgi:hypothetical protein